MHYFSNLFDRARPALFLIFVFFYVIFVLFYVFLCCSMYCLFCDVLCIISVYMCTELLPPGGYPIAVKYIISSYHTSTPPMRRTACTETQCLYKGALYFYFYLIHTERTLPLPIKLNTLRIGSFKLFKRWFPGFLTILTL
jgi:hypothetical protein